MDQRPIKFRGKVEGQWDYAILEDEHWDQFWALVNKKTIGQFIGLRDKNKKEIYEGDLLKSNFGIYKVIWDNELAGFVLEEKNGGLNGFQGLNLGVIGNIFDNPELF